ncbi:MAG: hypothetical protein OSB58_22140 [Alphaproteobacteria bacterium]|nr:hypothetical protein [Alphaproteobacteria bacterium]
MSTKSQLSEAQDNPHDIAAWLIKEHGLMAAQRVVLDEVLAAQERGDFYRLSVFREVRRVLAQHPDEG